MLTSKQRAYLRGKANGLSPLFQIGKEGIADNLIQGIGEALENRELIKVTLLETADIRPKDACTLIAAALKAESVQCIGRRFVLYKESKNHKTIELPR